MISQEQFEKVLRDLRKKASTDSFLIELLTSEEIFLSEETEDSFRIKIPYVNANPMAEAMWV